jgi:hypothetical protein
VSRKNVLSKLHVTEKMFSMLIVHATAYDIIRSNHRPMALNCSFKCAWVEFWNQLGFLMKKIFALLFFLIAGFPAAAADTTGHWGKIMLASECASKLAQCDFTYTSANAWIVTYKNRQFALAVIDDGDGYVDVALAVLQGSQWLARVPRIVPSVSSAMIAKGPDGPRTTLSWIMSDVLPGLNVLMEKEVRVTCPADVTNRLSAFKYDIGSGNFDLDPTGKWVITAAPLSHATCPRSPP